MFEFEFECRVYNKKKEKEKEKHGPHIENSNSWKNEGVLPLTLSHVWRIKVKESHVLSLVGGCFMSY